MGREGTRTALKLAALVALTIAALLWPRRGKDQSATSEEHYDEERVTGRRRVDVKNTWLNRLLDMWFLIAVGIIVLAAEGAWLVFFVPNADVDSAQWTLSALVQGMAAIFGTTFVALTFIWSEAERSVDRLRSIRHRHVDLLALVRHDVTDTRPNGSRTHYLVSNIELYRRSLTAKLESGELQDSGGLLQRTKFKSHLHHLETVSALANAVQNMHSPRYDHEAYERTLADLRTIAGVDKEKGAKIDADLSKRSYEIETDPVEFFDVLTDVFDTVNPVPPNVDKQSGVLLDNVLGLAEQDNVYGLVRRVWAFQYLRGWPFKLTALFLFAAMTSGLTILSGYDESTPVIVLEIPVVFSLLATISIALMIQRILSTK